MLRPKKVLHIFGSLNTGGAETLIMRIYRNINKEKVQFDFLVASKEEGFYEREVVSLGGKIIRIRKPAELGIIRYIISLYKILNENGPYEVVHSHVYLFSGINNMVAEYANVPKRISHIHTTKVENANKPLRKLYQLIMKQLIRKYSTDFFACSIEAKKNFFSQKINNDKCRIIKNGVNLKSFKGLTPENSEIKKIINKFEGHLLIGHVGRFVEVKNHIMILDIFSEVKKRGIKAKLILVGDGPLKSKIEKETILRGLKEEVIILESRNDIPDILRSLDILIFPSLIEGFGMVVLEAQCARLQCIISDTVPKEVDMGVNLVNFISLSSDVNYWVDKLLEVIDFKKPSFETISKSIKLRGYDINKISLELEEFYLGQ